LLKESPEPPEFLVVDPQPRNYGSAQAGQG
jgi:hypothetical protein